MEALIKLWSLMYLSQADRGENRATTEAEAVIR
jgi:hypothetical protein